MTDFFGDLERELRAAHARDERGWRPALRVLLPRRSTVVRFAMASAASVAVIALVTLVLANAGGDPEREVAAPGVGEAACADGDPAEDFSVLARPGTAADRLDRADSVAALDPATRVFPARARLVRVVDGMKFWLVPACANSEPAVCIVRLETGGQGGRLCGTARDARAGQLHIGGQLRAGGSFRAAPLPDDIRDASVTADGERFRGRVRDNLVYLRHPTVAGARFEIGTSQSLHSPDTLATDGWTAYAPACPGRGLDGMVERLAVLRRPPDPPTDFRLDEPSVVYAYGEAGRFVRYGNGLEVLVMPVELGECGTSGPGICLIPSDRDWATDCFAVPDDEALVAALKHDNGDEVEVVGVVDDEVRAVEVDGLEVESQAGTVLAVVRADEPSQVSVRPVE